LDFEETVQERRHRIKKMKDLTKKIGGYTFPGVTEDQLVNFGKIESPPDPMFSLEKISITGEMVLKFNQPMIYPSEMKDFNYTNLIDVSFVSAKNGRII
jgi:hypothetical protein